VAEELGAGDEDPVVGLGVGVDVAPHNVFSVATRDLADASWPSRPFWAARTAACCLAIAASALAVEPEPPLPLLPPELPELPELPEPLVLLLLPPLLVVVEVWLALSEARRTASVATVYWALLTWEASEVVLSRARTCPVVTCEPRLTETEATCPETGKLTLAWLTGSIVPVEVRVWVTLARVTLAVR